MFVGLRKRLRWQGVFLGLRFVAIRACRPEVCRLFDQGQQRYGLDRSFAHVNV